MRTLSRFLTIPAVALSLTLGVVPPAVAGNAELVSSVTAEMVKPKKQTQAGLYITAAESAGVLNTREDVLLIDVRTPEETMLVGYPTEVDVNIPFKLIDPAHKLNEKKGSYVMVANPGFIPAVTSFLEGKDVSAVLVMCRSGGRSAKAVDALTKAGVSVPLYSVVDGFEGDKNAQGLRVVNGWKNAGAPWTSKVRAGLLQGVD